jgi:hypothetical protein
MTTGQINTLTGSLESVGLGNLDGLLVATIPIAVPYEPVLGTPVLVLPTSFSWVIPGGDLSGATPAVAIRETETAQLTIKLEFFKEIPGSSPVEYEETAIWTIYPIIPNTTGTDISELADTGFTNDSLATGAIFIARAMLTEPAIAPYIAQFVGITKQPGVPPVSPAPTVGDVWYRSDTFETFRYSTESNSWLKDPEEFRSLPFLFSASSVAGIFAYPKHKNYTNFFLWDLIFSLYVAATNDGSNYWTVKVQKKVWGSPTPVDLDAPFDVAVSTAAIAANTFTRLVQSIGDFEAIYLQSNIEYFNIIVTKVGSPGNLSLQIDGKLSYKWNT